jgi:lysozyme
LTLEDFVRGFESCKLVAYWDQFAKIFTNGWGHTGKDVFEGQIITQPEADDWMEHDCLVARTMLKVYSPALVEGTPNFEALSDFVFNLGSERYRTSTLRQLVNANNWKAATLEILKWDHSNGVVIPGLLRRRQAEAAQLVA